MIPKPKGECRPHAPPCNKAAPHPIELEAAHHVEDFGSFHGSSAPELIVTGAVGGGGVAAPAARCGSGQWRRVGSPLCRTARRLFRSRLFRAIAHRLE